MKTVVIYQSKYGFTEIYAKWLAEDLDADLLTADKVQPADFQKYSTIVYGGGLYAGRVSGITLLTRNSECLQNKSLYLFTVGAADVSDPENTSGIRSSLEKVLTPALQKTARIYHLRGGMLYSKMSFVHRVMMRMMMNLVRKKPESELRIEDHMMLKTYGQDVDFTNRQSIAPLVADIKAGATPQ